MEYPGPFNLSVGLWLNTPASNAPTVRTSTPREIAGRNEPCPCGSGKKYKKCCIGQHKDDIRFPFVAIGLIGLALVAMLIAKHLFL
jgi:hypothetical protein